MTRPTLNNPLNAASTGWVNRLNENFQKLLDAPFPIFLASDITALNTKNPGLYANCLAIVGTDKKIYRSNGTTWALYDVRLTCIAALDTGTATVASIKTAYNSLLTDMRSKGLMAAS